MFASAYDFIVVVFLSVGAIVPFVASIVLLLHYM